MPVASTDLVLYCSTNMPTADTGTSGGALPGSNRIRPTFSTGQISGGNSILKVESTGTGDGSNKIRITGRDAGGSIVTEDINISGTAETYVQGAITFERVLLIDVRLQSNSNATTAVGTLTIRKLGGSLSDESGAAPIISTIAAGEHGVRIVFYDAASSTSSAKTLYEKIYARNNHGSLNLTNAKVAMTADPDAVMEWGFATADAQSTTNRVTTVSGPTWRTDTAAYDVPIIGTEVDVAGVLGFGEAAGIWLKMDLLQNNAPIRSSVTLQVTGTTV